MAQAWAESFYHSGAWKRNRKAYLEVLVDVEGNRVYQDDDGSYYHVDDSGYRYPVSQQRVVPPGCCEQCFARGNINNAKLVHHITHLTPENIHDPHITLSYDNFMRVCQDCHAELHAGTENGVPKRVEFDEQGNIIWVGE